ncbi:MAG: 16S rRNA (adenine(1518)-N(6)/adenine(1519)-N(6))-dimethyltransferase RsmA [Paracoccaceae bacterium]
MSFAADGLPRLRDVIRAHDLRTRKSLGQNFLLDMNLTARIARQAGALSTSDIVEVGPGPGGLTRALLAQGARKVVAIEKDERCLPALRQIADHYPGRLEIVAGDALRVDLRDRLRAPVRIVANLPYNIGTELLTRWLSPPEWPPFWESLTLMFQKEVARRIVSPCGNKTYGRLSVLSQWRTDARIVMTIPPAAFTPPPKVESAVVHLKRRAHPLANANPATLSRVVAAAFGQRRKMLRQSLKPLAPTIIDILNGVGIAPSDRAENVPIEGFCAIARALEE